VRHYIRGGIAVEGGGGGDDDSGGGGGGGGGGARPSGTVMSYGFKGGADVVVVLLKSYSSRKSKS